MCVPPLLLLLLRRLRLLLLLLPPPLPLPLLLRLLLPLPLLLLLPSVALTRRAWGCPHQAGVGLSSSATSGRRVPGLAPHSPGRCMARPSSPA